MRSIISLLCLAMAWTAQVQAQIPLQAAVQVGTGGSGVVVQTGDESLVLTANHVVVTGNYQVNGKETRILLQSEERDLALLAVKERLPSIPIVDGRPQVGSEIFIVGCPYGRCFAITRGYVSSAADQDGDTVVSATAYPGNSGGPMLWYSSLRRTYVLAGVARGIYQARSGPFSAVMVTTITFVRMDFRDFLKEYVRPLSLRLETR